MKKFTRERENEIFAKATISPKMIDKKPRYPEDQVCRQRFAIISFTPTDEYCGISVLKPNYQKTLFGA